jgi:hypothetical protein
VKKMVAQKQPALNRWRPALRNTLLLIAAASGLYFYAIPTLQKRQLEQSQMTADAEKATQYPESSFDFANATFLQTWTFCRERWQVNNGQYFEPFGLAWTRTGMDGYFIAGDSMDTLRRFSCNAEGTARGPRFARPWMARQPAESSSDANEAVPQNWRSTMLSLEAKTLTQGLNAMEFLVDPQDNAIMLRRWDGVEAGAIATPDYMMTGGIVFPLLIAAPPFSFAPGSAPAPLTELTRYHWLSQTNDAFALLAKSLPDTAGIVELTIENDEIAVSIQGTIKNFDNKPPAPYGDMDFDEYGIAGATFWYPREIPGFGCQTGRTVDQVSADFASARQRQAGPKLAEAWYSCSPAFTSSDHGAWHLTVDSN